MLIPFITGITLKLSFVLLNIISIISTQLFKNNSIHVTNFFHNEDVFKDSDRVKVFHNL